jgi:hypothetical protein
MLVLVEKLLAAASLRNQDLGIVAKRKNHPDQNWALIILATISPLDEVFDRAYVPEKIKRGVAVNIQEVAMP